MCNNFASWDKYFNRFFIGSQYLSIQSTLKYLIAKQEVISEQGGILQKIVKQEGQNKGEGWNILVNLIREQAYFHTKMPFMKHYKVRKP